MSEERKRILGLLQNGKISADEADQLLEAMPGVEQTPSTAVASASKGRFIRVHVVEHGKEKVNVNVPLGLAKFLLKFVPSEARSELAGHNIDLDEIVSQIKADTQGKIVEVVDGDTRVDVYVE